MQNVNTIIEDWVEAYTEDLINRALTKIPDIESVKDIVQETFLAVSMNINTYEQKSNPKTWIFSILNNKISDYYRKKYKQGADISLDALPSNFSANEDWIKEKIPMSWQTEKQNLLDDSKFIEILNYCLEHLPHKFSTVINMKYFSNKKPEEICQELDISTTNMWQIMHRAKLKLRDCIETAWFKNN